MATVINNPNDTADSSGLGVIVGVIIALALIILAVFYFVPAIRGAGDAGGGAGAGGTQINVPDSVDVNFGGGASGGTGGTPAQ
jgi:hypothetical protein